MGVRLLKFFFHTRNDLSRWLSHWGNYIFAKWAIALKENTERIIGFGGLSVIRYD